jgi:dienelactone hydrolase
MTLSHRIKTNAACRPIMFFPEPGPRMAALAVLAIVILVGAAAFLCVAATDEAPLSPTGQFGVGVTTLAAEPAATAGSRPLLRFWYPGAEDPEPPRAPGWNARILRRVPLGAWIGDKLRPPQPLPIALYPSRFPVLIDVPSGSGSQADNEILLRELVSRGFIVVTLEYGEPVRRGAATPSSGPRPMDFSSAAAFEETLRWADELTRSRARDAVWAADRLAALDKAAEQADSRSRFAGRLDLQNLGIFGFSLGGAAAAQACWLDDRFHAAVNLDGWHFADAAEHGVRQPYLLFSDDTPLPSAADLVSPDPLIRDLSILNRRDGLGTLGNLHRNGGIRIRLAGSRHLSFTDRSLRRASRGFSDYGSIDPRRALEIVDAYVAAFFEIELKGKDSAQFAVLSNAMPEAQVQVWSPRLAAQSMRQAAQ